MAGWQFRIDRGVATPGPETVCGGSGAPAGQTA